MVLVFYIPEKFAANIVGNIADTSPVSVYSSTNYICRGNALCTVCKAYLNKSISLVECAQNGKKGVDVKAGRQSAHSTNASRFVNQFESILVELSKWLAKLGS
jgi:hypothetical protein